MDKSRPRLYARQSDRVWDIEDRYAAHPDIGVTEPEEEYSGLLDAQGNPLFRRRDAVGFLPKKS